MTTVEGLEDVLVHELQDLFSAENQLKKALPKVIKAASRPSLQEALSEHLEVTEEQIQRLNQIAELMQIKIKGETCDAMMGLIKEGEKIMDEYDGDPNLIDAMLIGACQRIEHYEIAGYGTARTLAEALGQQEVAQLLQETLDEEEDADEKLSEISEDEVLAGASMEESEEEEEEEGSERMPTGGSSRSAKSGGKGKSQPARR